MYEQFTRPLTAREKRALKIKMAGVDNQRIESWRSNAAGSFGCCGVLWVLTLAANWQKWTMMLAATAFWLLMAGIYTVWGTFSGRKQEAKERTMWKQVFESALARNEARVTHIAAGDMVEFEEIDDEGACYAFQIDDGRIFFLEGQGYYPTARFPSTDFSIVEIVGADGTMVHWLFDNQGEKLEPSRTISADVKANLRIIEDRETIGGRLADLEQLLAK